MDGTVGWSRSSRNKMKKRSAGDGYKTYWLLMQEVEAQGKNTDRICQESLKTRHH